MTETTKTACNGIINLTDDAIVYMRELLATDRKRLQKREAKATSATGRNAARWELVQNTAAQDALGVSDPSTDA